MKILIVRHAKAEERTLLGSLRKKDAARTLTPGGRRDMAKAAKGLRRRLPKIDTLASSPLVRAKETAQILSRRFDDIEVVELPALAPGHEPEALLAWLCEQPPDATVALVGHEPDLGIFASYLLMGRKESSLMFKKGASCLIDIPDRPAAGAGRLEWLLQPGALRRLG